MHVDEVHTDAGLVRRLVAGQFPQWANLPIQRVPSAGTDNALYKLGDDLLARLPRRSSAAPQAEKDYEWLPRLAPHLPVPVPVPIAMGAPAEGYPWSWCVSPWFDGQNAVVGDASLARELAAFVEALHAIDPSGGPPAGEHNFFRGAPLIVRDGPTRAAIAALHGVVDTEAVTTAWDAALTLPQRTAPPVWVHGDLAPGNLILAYGRLSAVIDFGCLGVGDPAVDLIAAWNLLRPDAREVYRAALHVDDATWARGRGWALSIALIQLPYYKDTNPTLAASSRHVIGEVLASR
jgi:aminoglycoside phosphotransferase (APT) family kinase protein